jgi:UDP-GlcNAc:undecaprenyl-phosphate GlcNAc-1-phosphate transferase
MQQALLSVFILSLLTSLFITWQMRKLALRLSFVDRPGTRKRHLTPTPQGGGIAICVTTSAMVLGGSLIAYIQHHIHAFLPLPDSIAAHMAGAAGAMPILLRIFGGGVAIALLGLIDDIRPLNPYLKLLVQVFIISVVVLTGAMPITLFIPSLTLQTIVTIMWIVFLTNSFNLLDNMDGLSSTVSFVCGGTLLICALQTGQFFIAALLLALMGAIAAFLFFNFPPASIFMGDSGSTFIGYMLATSTVLTTFLVDGPVHSLFPAIVPLIIFAVPIYDTLSVVTIRLRHGKPVFSGDKNHLSHRLYRLGMSERRVLATICLMTLATALGATIPYGSTSWQLIAPAIQAFALICVMCLLELTSAEIHYPEENGEPPRD